MQQHWTEQPFSYYATCCRSKSVALTIADPLPLWRRFLATRRLVLSFVLFILGILVLATYQVPGETPQRLRALLHAGECVTGQDGRCANLAEEGQLPTSLLSDHAFDEALYNLTELTPTEDRMKELLSPIDYSKGTSMLHDLAVRTRVFRLLFAAWESVHISTSADSIFAEDSVAERIRRRSSYDPDGDHDLRGAIRDYDRARTFMHRFTQHLFPWTMSYVADHMMLHAGFYRGGRGIVITLGDHQVAYALTSIKTFRQLGCELPIEIFFLGNNDLNADSRMALEQLPGVTTRDLSQMIYDDGWSLKGWAAKPMAALLSSFREVILIDADVLFFTDPTTLFSDSEYSRTGALFFRDRLLSPTSTQKKVIEDSLPEPLSPNVLANRWYLGTSFHVQESGVVVIDKWRHFVALLLTTRLNGPDRNGDEATGKKGVYQMMHGDKETFWLSWEMAGDQDYAFHDGQAGVVGALASKSTIVTVAAGGQAEKYDEKAIGKEEMCGKQLLHTTRDGRPLWFNGWIAVNKDWANHLTAFQEFRGFITEPHESVNDGRPFEEFWRKWEVHVGNLLCLPGENYTTLSAGESKTMDMILRTATEVSSDLSSSSDR